MIRRFGFLIAGLALMLAPAALSADEPSKSDSPDPAALFDQLDANHDGQLSASEVPRDKRRLFERLLRAAHKDKSDNLSRDEFVAGLKGQRGERPLEKPQAAGQFGRPDPEQMFNRLDANHDGKVTLDEVPEERREMFQALLARADKDGDGALSKEEWIAGFKTIEEQLRPAARPNGERMFQYLDKNGDGKITLDEVPAERRPMFEKLIARFDKDGDKALSQEEFREGFKAIANRLDEAGSGKMPKRPNRPGGKGPSRPQAGQGNLSEKLMQLDTNKDGKISLEEFSAPMKKRFNKLDANGDGYIDAAELKAAAERMGQARDKVSKKRPKSAREESESGREKPKSAAAE